MFAHLRTVVLLAVLTILVKADDDIGEKCVPTYCGANYSAIFKKNHTYVYNYDFEIRMESNREEGIDQDVFNFNSTVEIYADSTCNLILKMDAVNLTPKTTTMDNDTTNEKSISELLTENLLIFQYNNGQITKLCASKSDVNWVLNLKLGILSALQYTYLNVTDSYNVMETNLLGDCNSVYKISQADGWRVVRKAIDLQRCSYRTGFEKVTRNLLDDSTTLIENTHKCRHVLGTLGEPILIMCRENYTIQPFDDFSTRMRIKQQMDLDRVILKNGPDYNDELFETLESRQSFHVTNDSIKTVNDEESILQDIIDNYEDTPSINSDFISMLQSLKYIEYSSLKILAQLQNLLQNQNLWPSIQLVSSSLINIYCSNNPECYDVKEVKQIMKIIELPLKHKFNGDLDQFIVSLKGIGNAGISYNMDKIVAIIQENTLPLVMRMAAIDSFRRMPCHISRDHLLNIFASQEDYQEIRMKAFFAMMICPSNIVINHIANVLYYDNVNQVTSTVWFYLLNLKNSHTFEEGINNILLNQYIQAKFEHLSIRNSFRMRSTIDKKLTIFNHHSHLDVFEISIFDELFNKSYNVMQIGGMFKRLKNALEVSNERDKKCFNNNNLDQHLEDNFIENSSQENHDNDGYLYLRIAGFDMFYWNVSSLKSTLEEVNKNDFIYKQIRFNREFNILDNVFVVPTSIGLPLEVRIFGVSSIRINNTMTNKQRDPCNVFPESVTAITSDLTIDSVMKIRLHDRDFKTENHEVSNVEEEIEQTMMYDKGRLILNNV